MASGLLGIAVALPRATGEVPLTPGADLGEPASRGAIPGPIAARTLRSKSLDMPATAPLARTVDRRVRRARRPLASRFLRTFAVVFALLLGLRLFLPSIVHRYVSRVLDGAEGYSGTVAGLDLNLWRGAYELTGVEIFREGGSFERPFVRVERVDISVRWIDLLRGRVVAEVALFQPRIEFVSEASATDAQTGQETSWSERIGKLSPFRIERFTMRDAEVRFTHRGIDPPVDLFLTDGFLEILNLTNIQEGGEEKELWAEAEAAGRPFGTGEFEARLRFDPLAEEQRFELDAALRGIEMIELNDFLQAYGNVDAEGGTLEAFAEFAVSDRQIEGYVKTLIEDLQLARFNEIDDPIDALQSLWEAFVQLGAELLENQPHDRLAVRVPVRGELGATSTDMLSIVSSLLRNAFVIALRPAIDKSVEIGDLEITRPSESAEGEERSR